MVIEHQDTGFHLFRRELDLLFRNHTHRHRRLQPEVVVEALLWVEGRVEEVQIGVRAEQADALLHRLQHDLESVRQPLAVLSLPNLGRDEYLIARDARVPHCAADVFLVFVECGGVQMPAWTTMGA